MGSRKCLFGRSGSKSHLSSYESGSDVETGVLRVGNPFLVHLHQLLDAFQQFSFIEELRRQRWRLQSSCSNELTSKPGNVLA